jgi:hypothetical protein
MTKKETSCLKRILRDTLFSRMIKPKMTKWAGYAAYMEDRNACRILMGKPEGKRPLGRPRHK